MTTTKETAKVREGYRLEGYDSNHTERAIPRKTEWAVLSGAQRAAREVLLADPFMAFIDVEAFDAEGHTDLMARYTRDDDMPPVRPIEECRDMVNGLTKALEQGKRAWYKLESANPYHASDARHDYWKLGHEAAMTERARNLPRLLRSPIRDIERYFDEREWSGDTCDTMSELNESVAYSIGLRPEDGDWFDGEDGDAIRDALDDAIKLKTIVDIDPTKVLKVQRLIYRVRAKRAARADEE